MLSLKQLTEEGKEALIVELWEEIQKSQKRLEKKPKKTSWNSSLPPAKGFKADVKAETTRYQYRCRQMENHKRHRLEKNLMQK
jgi:transposase